MSESGAERVPTVAVAAYGFRHEAEFAAGFLDDAGIPYRLQIDDPAMGMSSAVIWVREIDEAKARALLEVQEGETVTLTAKAESSGRGMKSSAQHRPAVRSDSPNGTGVISDFWPRLSWRARGLALFAGVTAAAAVQLIDLPTASMGPRIAVTLAAFLGGIALLGRAPRSVGSVLQALTGDAP
jgi:hypothetical protein